ncbi:quinone oxidoreductase family protein [Longibacter sp.]|uniref:quinone oxidoreductase family protein n=1 Tax=Longibacter sp. TaxID=2045415 RepID=UPI003EBB331C
MPQSIQITTYGPPSVLTVRDITLPPVDPTSVRFRVDAAPVNRADLEIRAGNWPVHTDDPFPYTPGLEAVGVVTDVGSDVTDVAVGQRVITMMQGLGGVHATYPGGYQSHVTVPADHIAIVPDGIDSHDIAALGLAAVTAHQAMERLGLTPGQRLLIHGASGGVGSAAVRLARAQDLQVVAGTTRPENETALRDLGADEVAVVNDRADLAVSPVDGVLDPVGQATFSPSVNALRDGGRYVLVGAASGTDLSLSAWDLMRGVVLTGYSTESLDGKALRQSIAVLADHVEAGRLPPPPYRTLPLDEAPEAHRMMEARRHHGRLLLVPAG